MRLITCPEEFTPRNNPTQLQLATKLLSLLLDPIIFIAGDIVGCPNWQKELASRFDHHKQLYLLNPRTPKFDSNNSDMYSHQIEWEQFYFTASDAVLFWFCWETSGSRALYQLGTAVASGKTIFVGCHPGYTGRNELQKQLSLARPTLTMHSDFTDLVTNVEQWLTLNIPSINTVTL
jgi:Nucleoside 2-deoxyribosyltransferase like